MYHQTCILPQGVGFFGFRKRLLSEIYCWFMVFSLELKHRQVLNNCALASLRTFFNWPRNVVRWLAAELNPGPSHSDNNRLAPKLADHRTENTTEPWTKIQVRMLHSMGWRRFNTWFERKKGCVLGTGYYYKYKKYPWGLVIANASLNWSRRFTPPSPEDVRGWMNNEWPGLTACG